jgi:SAM-dependent methyltransferase
MAQRVGSHYGADERGADYFRYQAANAEIIGTLVSRKFAPVIRPTDCVVDFGCGTGHTLLAIKARRRIGVDPNPRNQDVARRLGMEVVGTPDELTPGEADVVISNHVLEHTLEPHLELSALGRALKPEGRLMIVVPIDDWRSQRRAITDDRNHHLYTWTPRLLTNLLREAKFEVASCAIHPIGWPGRWTAPTARRLPRPFFDLLTQILAVPLRRREIRAIARPLGHAQSD